ncbi:MAG: hypothetical protein K6E94_00795, partial [Elusimicrobiaceae bacterium]|nr:hypothetical protein [Elusimicrobiaceae bacterium]
MKKFIILSLSVLCLMCALNAQEVKYNSPTLKMLLESEVYDAKHKQDLVDAFNETVAEAKKAKVANKEDVFKLIVPKRDSDKYHVDFDDFFVYCVLEALGLNNNLYLVDIIDGDRTEGYFAAPRTQAAIASDNEKNKQKNTVTRNLKYYDYFYSDGTKFLANPSNKELDTAFTVFTKDDIKSLILSREAYAKFYAGISQYYPKRDADIDILRQAEKTAKQALKISPRNTQAIKLIGRLASGEMPYSFYNPDISEADKIKTGIISHYDIQMLAITVANRANNYAAKYPDPFICNASKYCKTSLTDEMKANMSSKAFIDVLQKNPDVRSNAGGTIMRLYNNALYDEDYYKTVLYLGNEYAKFKDINKLNDVHVFYAQMAMASAILKNYQDFYKYQKLFDDNFTPSDGYNPEDYGAKMKNAAIAVEIVTGKKTPEQFVQEYNNGIKTAVHIREIDGKYVPGCLEAQRILSAWDGYKNFRERVEKLTGK